jgi:cell division protein ZapA (FtsZ GTPase activity inhibitor)
VNRALTIALAGILTLLCGLCLWQWKREADFRAAIASLDGKLDAETRAHHDALKRITILEGEIQRLSKLRDDTEAQYLTTLQELRSLQPDWAARGHTIDALSRLAAAAPAAESQNDAITRQNEMLKQLAAQRDDAIQKLNARTRELNAVTEKYNRLVKER